jgi:hypothetical protein
MDYTRQLESVLIEMVVAAADLPASGFEAVVSASAVKTDGEILFNVRVDERPDVQRIAAIASQSVQAATLLVLDRSGTSIKVYDVPAESYPALASVLLWADQPLPSQAATDVSSEVASLLEAVIAHAARIKPEAGDRLADLAVTLPDHPR